MTIGIICATLFLLVIALLAYCTCHGISDFKKNSILGYHRHLSKEKFINTYKTVKSLLDNSKYINIDILKSKIGEPSLRWNNTESEITEYSWIWEHGHGGVYDTDTIHLTVLPPVNGKIKVKLSHYDDIIHPIGERSIDYVFCIEEKE